MPARAALKVTRGEEFLYSGTLQFKQSIKNGPTLAISGSLKLVALVTEADPGKGYTVILMRQFQPEQKEREPRRPEDLWVTTVRYSPDLTASGMPGGTPDPILGPVLDAVRVPLPPRAELKPGDEWRQSVALPFLPPQPLETVSTVEGFGKVGDHSCLKIEKRLSQSLPVQQNLTDTSMEVTDYGETLCIDPDTGQVRSAELHESVGTRSKTLQLTNAVTLHVTLQETRQLPAAELANRVKQAETLDRVQRALLTDASGTDHQKAIEDASRDLTALQKEYPDSPYAPAVNRLNQMVSEAREEVQREARLQGLVGKPAPAFTLKDLAGKEQTLAAYRGKLILLSFFASW
jgi:hypothetical protein